MVHRIDRRAVLVSLGAAAGAGVFGNVLAGSAAKPVTTRLGERMLLISGLGGNVVALRGEEGLLLVDSGAPGAAASLQAELERFARGAKVHTVINTHWHADHTGGNDVFGKAGARIIAHAKARQRMATAQFVPWEDRYIQARGRQSLPTEVFHLGTKELRFGGETVEYGYLQQPHTDGDLYVHFRDSNVLVVGDVFAPVSDPLICWYEGGWVGGRIDAQAKMLQTGNDQTRIVAGTGGVLSRADVAPEFEAMQEMFERVSDAMRKGLTTEDMQNGKLLDGLPRRWSDPDKALYDAHKSMWAHYNKLSHSIV